MATWERSGLSQAAFCRQEGVSVHTFRWWRYSLRLRSEVRPVESEDRPPAFVELKVSPPVRVPLAVAEVAIEARGGALVWVRPGFDPATLREVLGLLGSIPC